MMFKPFLILLGPISITLAQDYFHSNYFDQESNNFGEDLPMNPDRSMYFLATGHDYQNGMISDYSDQNKGTILSLEAIFKHSMSQILATSL